MGRFRGQFLSFASAGSFFKILCLSFYISGCSLQFTAPKAPAASARAVAAAALVGPAAPGIGSPVSFPFYSNGNNVTISGTCVTGNTVNLTGASTQSMVCAGGAYSFLDTHLADATYNYSVTQTDVSGTSTASTAQWIRDTAVVAPTITSPTGTGTYSSAGGTISIAGACETGATVNLTGSSTQSMACAAAAYSFSVSSAGDAVYNYSVAQTDLALNTSGGTAYAWTVASAAPTGLSYPADYQAFIIGQTIPSLTPTVTGSSLTWTAPGGLPPGLSINAGTGVISGTTSGATPAVPNFSSYTITATNGGGSTSFTYHFLVSTGYIVNDTTDVDQQAGYVAGSACKGSGLAVGQCTLRAALTLAQLGGSATRTISILNNANYSFSSADLPAISNASGLTTLIISGQSTAGVVIDGGSTRHFMDASDVNLTLSNLTIQHSTTPGGCGGGVVCYTDNGTGRSFTARNVTFSHNSATDVGGGTGGALEIYAPSGTLGVATIDSCLFDTNSSVWNGGAISYDSASSGNGLVITKSTFTNNSTTGTGGDHAGGAIHFDGANAAASPLTITDSTFTGNTTKEWGGAIYLANNSTASISRSTFVNNSATVGGSCVGGAIANSGTPTTLVNDTFYGNSSCAGGAIYQNNATGNSTMNMSYTTIVNNTSSGAATGGGFDDNSGLAVTISKSIIAGNVANGAPNNCWFVNFLAATSGGYNIVDTPGGYCLPAAGFDQDMLYAAIKLDAGVASNGGLVQTLALVAGSPIINSIGAGACGATVTDARSSARPNGGACDPGAFEF